MAEDLKFVWNKQKGVFENRVSGEPIPKEEPILILRARDNHSVSVLRFYRKLVQDFHHFQALSDRINEFEAYRTVYPERMKEPGITHDIVLNDDVVKEISTKKRSYFRTWAILTGLTWLGILSYLIIKYV